MKKLLHIVLYLPYGGLEKIVYDFSLALNMKTYEVHVVALQHGGPMENLLRKAGIPVHILAKRPVKFDRTLLMNLVELIKKLDIQVIHSHSGCIMYAALAGRLAGIKNIVHTEHGRYLPEPFGKILEDRLFAKLIKKYVCVSRELEDYLTYTVKVHRKKLTTIINGINTDKFVKYSDDDIKRLRDIYNISYNKIVLWVVCRLIVEKNVEFLIDWMIMNSHKYKDLQLLVVGEGPQFSYLTNKASMLPNDKIIFLGAQANIADLLNLFNIFVLPSTTEGTSLTVLEAMSVELPVVISAVGGNKSIVSHNITGMLFNCNDFEEFELCIDNLLADMDKMKVMGKMARNSVKENFSFDKMLDSYLELYASE